MGTRCSMRQEAEVGTRAGRVPELPFSGISRNRQPPPSAPSLPPAREGTPPQAPPLARRPSLASHRRCAPQPPHLGSVAQGPRAGLPLGLASPRRLQAALPRGRGHGLTGRPPRALQPMALGPAAPAHSVPGTFSWRLTAAAAATGRRVRAGEHALRGHARGGRTGRGARGSSRAGWLPRSRGHAATAAPTGGSRSRPRPGPARARRAVPRRCRSALTLARARAPPATLAPRHPAPHGLPPPLREPSLCRQPDKAPARGPLHHLPETGAFCHMSLGTLPNTPTHAHTPTRPRTHRQDRAQTRTVVGTLTDTR